MSEYACVQTHTRACAHTHTLTAHRQVFVPLKLAIHLTGCLDQSWTSLEAQMVKCLPTIQETRVQSLGREDRLEKEIATYSSILAWKMPWMEEPGRLQSMGSQRVGHD